MKYLAPLNISSAKQGDVEIRQEIKPPGTKMLLNSLRTTMFGQKAKSGITYKSQTIWHQLLIDGCRVMSDWPIEQRQIDEALKGIKGNVLVGGLGLGYATTRLSQRKTVKSVTTVEINQNVIDLVWPHTNSLDSVVCKDLLEYLKEQPKNKQFDYAFYDIWSSDGEGTFHEVVVLLYKLSKGRVRYMPICWNEDIMRGQLRSAIRTRLLFMDHPDMQNEAFKNLPALWENDGTDRPWHNWYVPYFKWWKETQPSESRRDNGADYYCAWYGKWHWEDFWKAFTDTKEVA